MNTEVTQTIVFNSAPTFSISVIYAFMYLLVVHLVKNVMYCLKGIIIDMEIFKFL